MAVKFTVGKEYETQFGKVVVVGPAADKGDHSQDGYVCKHCAYEGVPNLVEIVATPPTSVACPDCGKTEHER